MEEMETMEIFETHQGYIFEVLSFYSGSSIATICFSFGFLSLIFIASKNAGEASAFIIERLAIHRNMCFTLLISELLLAMATLTSQDEMICGILAGVLHYFLLSSLCWTLLEAFHLYHSLIQVSQLEKPRTLCFYCFGYGFPLLLFTISLLWNNTFKDLSSLFDQDYCSVLSSSTLNHAFVGFVGPATMLLFCGIVFLLLTLFVLCQHSSAGYKPCKQTDSNTVKEIRAAFKAIASLIFILALNYTFGTLWVLQANKGEETVKTLAMLLFSLTNALLGLVFLLGYVVFSEKMRKDFAKWLVANPWLPDSIRWPSGSTERKEFPKLSSPGFAPSSTNSTGHSRTSASSDVSECLMFSSTAGTDRLIDFMQRGKDYHRMLTIDRHSSPQSINYPITLPGMIRSPPDNNDYATIPYGDLMMDYRQSRPISARPLPIRVETPRVPYFPSASTSFASSHHSPPHIHDNCIEEDEELSALRTAPPNFPPPPPPNFDQYPQYPINNQAVHLCRHLVSPSPTTGSRGTLLLRMDLSRPQPVYSEEIPDQIEG